MPRALLSVSDKTGLVDFARGLTQRGWTLLSTGGTARLLREADIAVTEVSEMTGHPEIMEGRIKTLHPAVHSGLLARRGNPDDEREMSELGYEPIDLVAVNLYPFRETVARPGVTMAEAIENIDIGGPTMLRSAAKNHEHVWVVVDPADYDRVLTGLDAGGDALETRRSLAAKVFRHTSEYDRAITEHLGGSDPSPEALPAAIDLQLSRVQDLRYGENPDQQAAFYREQGGAAGLPGLKQLHGKELSFNNLLDVDAATLCVQAWDAGDQAACAVIKHTTPCGIAVADDVREAYRKALATDPTSAFGSIVAFNREVDADTAEMLRANFVEVVVAPGFGENAVDILSSKKNLRILEMPLGAARDLDFKRVQGGFLVQNRLEVGDDESLWRVVTDARPDDQGWRDLRFAWRAIAMVKSNAILIARDGAALGIGAGQMSRVDASRLAVMKAADQGHSIDGAALASDAFFPFRDGVDAAAAAGIRLIIQPGGSVRDEEVIEAANDHGIAMVFTGRRLFRH